MFQKRELAYRKMAYQLEKSQEKGSLFTADNYEKIFKKDLQEMRSSLLICTASLTANKIYEVLGLSEGKQVEFQIPQKHRLAAWLKGLEKNNFRVRLLTEKIPANLLVIDNSVVWYGSLSPLAPQNDGSDSLLRLESADIAEEFLSRQIK